MSYVATRRSVFVGGFVAILLALTAIFPSTVSTPGAKMIRIPKNAALTVAGYQSGVSEPTYAAATNLAASRTSESAADVDNSLAFNVDKASTHGNAGLNSLLRGAERLTAETLDADRGRRRRRQRELQSDEPLGIRGVSVAEPLGGLSGNGSASFTVR
jgi:hypothetical protein